MSYHLSTISTTIAVYHGIKAGIIHNVCSGLKAQWCSTFQKGNLHVQTDIKLQPHKILTCKIFVKVQLSLVYMHRCAHCVKTPWIDSNDGMSMLSLFTCHLPKDDRGEKMVCPITPSISKITVSRLQLQFFQWGLPQTGLLLPLPSYLIR